MKRAISVVGLAVLLALLLALVTTQTFSAGNKVVFPTLVQASVNYVGTYANSQVDTLIYNREPGVTNITLAGYWIDSVKVTDVVIRRFINGKQAKENGSLIYALGDTLTDFSAKTDT